jgi:hypothetical protein
MTYTVSVRRTIQPYKQTHIAKKITKGIKIVPKCTLKNIIHISAERKYQTINLKQYVSYPLILPGDIEV